RAPAMNGAPAVATTADPALPAILGLVSSPVPEPTERHVFHQRTRRRLKKWPRCLAATSGCCHDALFCLPDPNNVSESADGVQQGAHAGDNSAADAKEVHEEDNPQRSTEKQPADEPVGGVDGAKDVLEVGGDADRGEGADLAAKPKKCRLVCKECGKRFTRRETFNLHRHFHGNFECAECGRIFYTVDKLRDHNCSNTVEKPYHCPLCRQDFQFKVSVTKHMMAHSQESMFACRECNQTFPNTMALRCHQRCHAALKPYECPECGMVFKHYSVMEDHRRKHTDNTRSHLCNICGKIFKYSSLLHQHQYLHTGQKPFRCPECGKHFALAQNMKAHCRQHRLQ
uniref:Zgc:66448 n=1 Tax=Scophthalmus maximus TaxID=52904 RepID=A0A8D3D4H3_SCOMX